MWLYRIMDWATKALEAFRGHPDVESLPNPPDHTNEDGLPREVQTSTPGAAWIENDTFYVEDLEGNVLKHTGELVESEPSTETGAMHYIDENHDHRKISAAMVEQLERHCDRWEEKPDTGGEGHWERANGAS